MTTQTNTTAATAAESKDKAKTVGDNMTARRVFANPAEAAAYLTTCAQTFTDFGELPFAAPGVDSEGNFDSSIYNDQTETMVAKLTSKGGGVKAIVVAPIPTLDAIMAHPEGPAWVRKIIHKQLNHVAVAALREAADISTVVDQMPTTLDGYISSSRDGGAGIMESFNELYKQVNATLSAKVPVWAKARLIKSELKKALESRGYALEYYAPLEDRGEGKDSLFVTALQLMQQAAKRKGLDPTIFERWLDTRNAKTYSAADEADADELDVDSLLDSMMDEPADAEPAAE